MLAEGIAIADGFKSLMDGVKSLKDITDERARELAVSDIQSKIRDLQTTILATQAEQMKLVEELQQAKAAIASMNEWKAEKQRYAFKEIAKEVFA
jgi:hypothetical protein